MQYAGVNFIDTYQRKGLYPAKEFPVRLGTESSGVIVGLPTDEGVLKDPEYTKRGFKEGAEVAVVRVFICSLHARLMRATNR